MNTEPVGPSAYGWLTKREFLLAQFMSAAMTGLLVEAFPDDATQDKLVVLSRQIALRMLDEYEDHCGKS